MAKYRILLVDDEEGVLSALTRVLRDPDRTILAASNAEAAERIVKAEHPHLIICDYRLDGVNGMDFLKSVSRGYPDIVTILLTGHAELNAAIDAINQAILYKFIIKPWDDDALRITVRRALEHHAALAENAKLRNELAKRDDYLIQLEKSYPGITKVKRDKDGRIILE